MNLLIGCGTILFCLVIQCFGVAYLLRFLHKLEVRGRLGSDMVRSTMLYVSVMLILLSGHLIQIAVWAELFVIRGEFEDFPTAFYHSTVNFTSLGYGDIVMSENGRLLGALEAASGVMMFGLSTAVLFWVVQAMVRRIAKSYAEKNLDQNPELKRND